ncbi:MAG: hypothetical protein JNM47_08040 [Hyphomonadaceae bacterium]|nr:hypothetical protein [Hyphomonadaceae bacterium]
MYNRGLRHADETWSQHPGHDQPSHGDPPDYCSRDGAMALKEKIEAYWRERGMQVMIALHNVGFHPAIRAARYDVRSDMINGMPRTIPAARAPKLVDETYADDANDDDIVE